MEEDRTTVLPELKEILGAMIFGAERPISFNEMRRCLKEVAEKHGGAVAVFGDVRKKEIDDALEALKVDIKGAGLGFQLGQVAGGYRLHSEPSCGIWLKHLLKMEKPVRLSRPALETLAIVAYRQPVTRAQIEAVRGVAVDSLVKTLMELQLIRIVGRSELPGRPFLYGTTHPFLEHFGLNSLDDLSNIEPLLSLKTEQPATSEGGESALEDPTEASEEPGAESATEEVDAAESAVAAEPVVEDGAAEADFCQEDEAEFDDDDDDDDDRDA